jgi:hypothetical protein
MLSASVLQMFKSLSTGAGMSCSYAVSVSNLGSCNCCCCAVMYGVDDSEHEN